MSYCPKDFLPCPDDICHGSGCVRMAGHGMLERCGSCGALYDPDFEGCECDFGDDRDDYDGPDPEVSP